MSELVGVSIEGHVGILEHQRGPHNFFDERSLAEIGGALAYFDTVEDVRVVVLCAEGKNFCAGADLRGMDAHGLRAVYRAAATLFTTRKPVVAAVHGAAVGGGLGLALAADFRMVSPGVRLTANFAKLGFHHGFALSVTLPFVVGRQRSLDLLYTGRNVGAEEALAIGLADRISGEALRTDAVAYAADIAQSAPLSLQSIRSTLRRELVSGVLGALDVEATAQTELLGSEDLREGIEASVERRQPVFRGR